MTELIQVTTTVSDEADAKRIAAALVAQKLAACVQISGPIESTYQWKGQIEKSQEWQCVIKSVAGMFEQIEAAIRDLHSYDEPEIIAVEITEASQGYQNWVADSVKSEVNS